MKSIIRSNIVAEQKSSEIEAELFGNVQYIEDSAFSTGHQLVNVYGMPERRYEVRSEENALDVQVHGKSIYIPFKDIENHDEVEELPKEKPTPIDRFNARNSKPQVIKSVKSVPKPQNPPVVMEPKPQASPKMTLSEYRDKFPVGCRVSFTGYGRGTVSMNKDNYFVVNFDKVGMKPLNLESLKNLKYTLQKYIYCH